MQINDANLLAGTAETDALTVLKFALLILIYTVVKAAVISLQVHHVFFLVFLMILLWRDPLIKACLAKLPFHWDTVNSFMPLALQVGQMVQ